jgi:hypothetical protein
MTKTFKAGLVILGVLSAIDIAGVAFTDGEHPPMVIAIAGSVLGAISLALVVAAWRGVRRAVVPLVVLRALSALSAVPAFFEPDVPGGLQAAAGAGIVLTVLGLALTLAPSRRPVEAGVR